ncbi:dipeptidyl-peptidase 3 family protein [Sphingomonas sp. LT1P40]|uniref:dipeptidyl-peptidase 3 family protein n=1 Tax=Alteristakelama amylovorans TaxID=3096166 RepID=UPI002FC8FC5A
MRKPVILALLLATTACNQTPPADNTTATAETADYDLAAQKAKLAVIEMKPDVSFLNAEERQVVNLLIQASEQMSLIYRAQRDANWKQTRAAIEKAGGGLNLEMYDRYYGPWDDLAENRAFFGTTGKMPEGAGFYPTDLTKEAFDAYLAANPGEKAALTSPYTIVVRDGAKLKAIPYSVAFKTELTEAARLLNEAAAITTNPSLKKFLSLRAKAFLTDDYYESELAWMDLKDTPIEVAIGPYEVYTDRLHGQKTAFESFVTLKDPEESAALDKYKKYLRDMEANLPVDEKLKNFQRGFESPIAVAEQVRGGGDSVPGIQTVAFNLPNDERVREAKGAKKVILSNVLGAKYDRILAPMAPLVLGAEQSKLVVKKYMQLETLFHELSHSLGPGTITVAGKKTTVSEALKDQASGLEEAKADVMGAWNILFMMRKGELPAAEKSQLFATYLVGTFRAMRWGIEEAHGQGAAMQYNYMKAKGAFAWDEAAGRYRIDNAKFEIALRDLLRDMIVLQHNGDYAGVKAFMAKWAKLDPHAQKVIASMQAIPVDILPVYPDKV